MARRWEAGLSTLTDAGSVEMVEPDGNALEGDVEE
jgi:hypothetical protein